MSDPNPPTADAFKTYRGYYEVLSNRFIHGKQGEFVELDLTEGESRALIEAGHIQVAERPTQATTVKKGSR